MLFARDRVEKKQPATTNPERNTKACEGKRQSEVARGTFGTLQDSRFFRNQPLSVCKINSSEHPRVDSQSRQGIELQTQSSGPVSPAAAELHHRSGCAGNQRRICSLGYVGH